MEVLKDHRIIVLEKEELEENNIPYLLKYYPKCLAIIQKYNKVDVINNDLIDKIIELKPALTLYISASQKGNMTTNGITSQKVWYIVYSMLEYVQKLDLRLICDVLEHVGLPFETDKLNEFVMLCQISLNCDNCIYNTGHHPMHCAVNPTMILNIYGKCSDYSN